MSSSSSLNLYLLLMLSVAAISLGFGGKWKEVKGIDGNWLSWSDWGSCFCGSLERQRTRQCGRPKFGGKVRCGPLPQKEILTCNQRPEHCNINGGWSKWTAWSDCTRTCGVDGIQNRMRNCTKPMPQYEGLKCKGHDNDSRVCKTAEKCKATTTPTSTSTMTTPNLAPATASGFVARLITGTTTSTTTTTSTSSTTTTTSSTTTSTTTTTAATTTLTTKTTIAANTTTTTTSSTTTTTSSTTTATTTLTTKTNTATTIATIGMARAATKPVCEDLVSKKECKKLNKRGKCLKEAGITKCPKFCEHCGFDCVDRDPLADCLTRKARNGCGGFRGWNLCAVTCGHCVP